MSRRLLSLVEPGPAGFVHRPELAARDVRREPFALFASSYETAIAALGDHCGKVPALVITPAEKLSFEPRGVRLFHLGATPAILPLLGELAPTWLDLLLTLRDQDDKEAIATRELIRSKEDRARMQKEFNSFRESLMREMSEREVAQQALQESEARFRTIFDSMHDAIFIHDQDTGEVLDVNVRACELYGYERPELLRKTVGELSQGEPPYTHEDALSWVKRAAQGGEPQLFTWRARDCRGRLFWVEVNMLRARIAEHDRVLVVVRDITDRMQAEERQRELERQMLHAQKLESLGVLAGGIAHDFNNILAAILGNADLALLRLPADQSARCFLGEISTASRRAADLCRQMLAYAGRGHFSIEPIDLSAVVREMGDMLRVSISKKATVVYDLSHDLPPINADGAQIRQVIMNLIVNASEALDDRPGTIRISTGTGPCEAGNASILVDELEQHDPCVFVEVADTGIGMDEATRRRVFEPFFSTKFAGRGLGLAAVLGIVRGHKGAIELDSAPGRGSTFRIRFPAAPQPLPSDTDSPSPEAEYRGSGTVLVIDDDPLVLRVTAQMLSNPGFEVLTAADGRSGLELFRKHLETASASNPIACVVLDWMMPVMDGEQTLRELRRISPSTPVLVTTGGSKQGFAASPNLRAADAFLQKPFGADELLSKIRELVPSA